MSAPTDPNVHWSAGGDARLIHADGVQVTLQSSKPFPPGTPAAGTLAPATAFTLKVATSRKLAEGVWEVRGRLLSATTEVTAAFARAAAG